MIDCLAQISPAPKVSLRTVSLAASNLGTWSFCACRVRLLSVALILVQRLGATIVGQGYSRTW